MSEVIIDGAIPRTPRERVKRLLDYLEDLADEKSMPVDDVTLSSWRHDLTAKPDAYEFWHEVEDEIIDAIEERIPDDHWIEHGLHCPGDVVIITP